LLKIGWKTGTTLGYHTEMDDAFFVYILASKKNGTLYIGVTNNLARRLTEHKAKLVPGFTRKCRVDQLVYFETFSSILEARAREHALKRWRRAWKIALIEKLNPDWQDLTDSIRDRSPSSAAHLDADQWAPDQQRTASRCAASGARGIIAVRCFQRAHRTRVPDAVQPPRCEASSGQCCSAEPGPKRSFE
jgi:putative endonuclease